MNFLNVYLKKENNTTINYKSTLEISIITNNNETKNISELIKTME